MPLLDSDFNAFARALTHRFSERSKGLDADSRRILTARPSDQILAGFLTPRSGDDYAQTFSTDVSLDDTDVEVELSNDLPRDSAYEQTSIGLEWLAVSDEMSRRLIDVEVKLSVFVRRFPIFEEQNEHKIWERPRLNKPNEPQPTENNQPRVSKFVPTWTREDLPPVSKSIDLETLRTRRRIALDTSADIAASWNQIDKAHIYSGRRTLTIAEPDLVEKATYDAKVSEFGTSTIPVLWRPVIDVRLISTPTQPGCVRIALRVINQTEAVKDQYLDFVDPNLYAVKIKVSVPKQSHRMSIFRELPDSYRYHREMFAVGINSDVCGVLQETEVVLETETIPTKTVNRLEPREIPNAAPSFELLSADPVPILSRILEDMKRYSAEEWSAKLQTLNGVEHDEANKAANTFTEEITRFERGVQLLADPKYDKVKQAFLLMNEAMLHSARGAYNAWRLFQIVFIVSQLPGLASREYPELLRSGDDHVDVLWFAAGGGKTEAFLGLIVWQAFFDRLRDKRFGVTAYVRFPLRLLAFQQLQRLGRALASAELVRKREQLGGARFSIGDFVGRNVTPNRISSEDHSRFKKRGVDPRFQRIFECPFCDSEVRLDYEEDIHLIKHVCTNTNCDEGHNRLPIYIVDWDIYRFLPTVIVSTVDKIALLGYNQRFANLFGRFDLICYRHGATFKGSNKNECEAARVLSEGGTPSSCGTEKLVAGPFHDPAPALLIQDELHLLSEEVGAFDAHYETAVIEMTQRLGFMPWKIVAATATIEEYAQHAYQLYLKRARQFPAPGPEAYESFYYTQNNNKIGRMFVGVLGIGRKHTPAVTRTLSNIYIELQRARERADADPVAASLEYGTASLSREDFKELIFYYELPLTYVLTRKGSDQIAEAIETRVKGDLNQLSPNHGELIVDMFNGGVDFIEMAKSMQRISGADPRANPEERIRGLVTTNIIGHGVDVDRFNIIVFAGFTRLVAEYIQASGRVGRKYPGISIFVATPQNERDRSIFDRFSKFHEYLDRLVDPSAVNRWPDPALQRTMPGLLAGYLMGIAAHDTSTPIATVEDVQRLHAKANALNETTILVWAQASYGADQAPAPQRYKDRIANRLSNTYRLVINAPANRSGPPRNLGSYLGAMQSLRDIDDPGYIRVHSKDKEILKRLMNG
ncbi:MAG TPA: helicase-related protein [Pyrinomonadaceae bacterium]|nr:helicase-related protein [Pyrinomonadaceae bacterium]